jgi:hypothetical protein
MWGLEIGFCKKIEATFITQAIFFYFVRFYRYYTGIYRYYTGVYTHSLYYYHLKNQKPHSNTLSAYMYVCMRFFGKCERDTRKGDNCPKGFNINKSQTSVGKICHQQLGSETLLMERPRLCTERKKISKQWRYYGA